MFAPNPVSPVGTIVVPLPRCCHPKWLPTCPRDAIARRVDPGIESRGHSVPTVPIPSISGPRWVGPLGLPDPTWIGSRSQWRPPVVPLVSRPRSDAPVILPRWWQSKLGSSNGCYFWKGAIGNPNNDTCEYTNTLPCRKYWTGICRAEKRNENERTNNVPKAATR